MDRTEHELKHLYSFKGFVPNLEGNGRKWKIEQE